jgi:hypothetical protein
MGGEKGRRSRSAIMRKWGEKKREKNCAVLHFKGSPPLPPRDNAWETQCHGSRWMGAFAGAACGLLPCHGHRAPGALFHYRALPSMLHSLSVLGNIICMHTHPRARATAPLSTRTHTHARARAHGPDNLEALRQLRCTARSIHAGIHL